MKKILILPDIHTPVHNQKAVDLVCSIGRAWAPDIIVQLGDLLDADSVSSHTRKPSALTLRDECASANKVLDQLDKLGAAKRVITLGNHCARLERAILEKVPGLYGTCSVPELLKLKQRGWEWCNYREHIKIGKVVFTHDVGDCGATAHVRAKDAVGHSTVIGHTHRMAMDFTGTLVDGNRVGAMFGHLLDTSKVGYMYRARMRAWQLGFGSGVMRKDGIVFMRPHPILQLGNRLVCEFEGRCFSVAAQ